MRSCPLRCWTPSALSLPPAQDIRVARSRLTGEKSPDEIEYEIRMREEADEELAGKAEHSTIGGARVRVPVAPSALVIKAAGDAPGGGATAPSLHQPPQHQPPHSALAAAAADPTAESALGAIALPLSALGHTTFDKSADLAGAGGLHGGGHMGSATARGAYTTRHESPGHFHVHHMPPRESDSGLPVVAVYTVPAYFTYVSGAAHRDRLRNLFKYSAPHYLPGIGVVAISLQECYYADPDAIEAAGDLIQELQREGREWCGCRPLR
jgi:hypothetical protein